MAKKKHPREANPVQAVVETSEHPIDQTNSAALPAERTIPADSLVEEVQSFLDRRAALAKKLVDEIAATEKKLAELKKTAAMLFPENIPSIPRDKKTKKVKIKRIEKTDDASTQEVAVTAN